MSISDVADYWFGDRKLYLIVMCFAWCGFAQVSNSRLGGVITDPAGKAVSAASIVAVNDTKGVRFSTLTDDQGSYVLLSLPPGEYTVTVEAPGFRKAVLSGVILSVGPARLQT
jgi:hypothetical protein